MINYKIDVFISTHILTKRMTINVFWKNTNNKHFNSHPHEEDDQLFPWTAVFVKIFQLTSSRRGWLCFSCPCRHSYSISTHILTKRMTPYRVSLICSTVFQLTSSRRGWPSAFFTPSTIPLFQLTSSRRGWPSWQSSSNLTSSFQLTSSRRGWRSFAFCCYFSIVFQLTSSRRGWPL